MSRTPSEGRRFFSIATSRTLLASWQGIAWKAVPISRLAKPLIVQPMALLRIACFNYKFGMLNFPPFENLGGMA